MYHVTYVKESQLRMVLDQGFMKDLFGKLPALKPRKKLTYEEAFASNVPVKTKEGLVPFQKYDRYKKTPGKMANPFETVEQHLWCEINPDGTLVGLHDFLVLDDSPSKGTPNPVIAPIEWRKGKWWVHMHLEQRDLMGGWSLGIPGGYAQSLSSSQAMKVELKEEWGEAEVVSTFFPTDGLSDTWANRTTYLRPQRNGCFIFRSGTVVESTDPGGDEVIAAGHRIAIPLEATGKVVFKDDVVSQAVAYARACYYSGQFDQYKPSIFSAEYWF